MRGKYAPFWEHREGTPLPENGSLKTREIDIEDAAELYPELYRIKGDRVEFETMVSVPERVAATLDKLYSQSGMNMMDQPNKEAVDQYNQAQRIFNNQYSPTP